MFHHWPNVFKISEDWRLAGQKAISFAALGRAHLILFADLSLIYVFVFSTWVNHLVLFLALKCIILSYFIIQKLFCLSSFFLFRDIHPNSGPVSLSFYLSNCYFAWYPPIIFHFHLLKWLDTQNSEIYQLLYLTKYFHNKLDFLCNILVTLLRFLPLSCLLLIVLEHNIKEGLFLLMVFVCLHWS